ncbi:MAG: epoxyqueuosine reductase QueH [Desulfovibrionales bacterium]
MAGDRPRILVHICCGPCALFPLKQLRSEGFEPTGLFFNPNIHPLQEYLRRREALAVVAEKLDIRVLFKDDEYDPAAYFRRIVFREPNRCFHCYQLRLERTVSIARRGRFDFFTTTLLYSKFQKHETITALAKDLGTGKARFLYRDFREGWKEGIRLSQEMGIYRQQYCGCLYSEQERYRKELFSEKNKG